MINLSTNYEQQPDGSYTQGRVYTRADSPTSEHAERLLAELEGGHDPARPSGVFMLPMPRPGVLRAVEGRAAAAAVPGITGLTITIPLGRQVLPLPDGDRYLGFIFAEAATRREVEHALTAARDQLRVVIE